ncbi:MAG: exodeoxyribonuclease III [Coriobacteriia bacterium]|nr:exodeoxyribonuclease III [Coriobacteriia bacterium]
MSDNQYNLRCVSWNVNGLRATLKKEGFYPAFETLDADIFAIQETKLQEGQVTLELPAGYHQVWSSAERKGYAGTAVFSRLEPLQVVHTLGLGGQPAGAGGPAATVVGAAAAADAAVAASTGPAIGQALDTSILDREGRLCALEFADFWFINCYTPNSQDGLARIDLRLAWGQAFSRFCTGLAQDKPVIICGDLNVAHQEIDLKNPKTNRGNAGFSDEERADFQGLLDAGFIDSFRHLYPEARDAYSWWTFRANARARNIGWRIDYFLVSKSLGGQIREAAIWPEFMGSDHCPVSIDLLI